MRAIQLSAPGQLELVEVPEPHAGPGELVIRVGGAGLCHTDLTLRASVPPDTPAFTIGHETAGWVHEVGPGVPRDWLGTPVLVSCAWGCGRCESCGRGDDSLCIPNTRSGVFGGGLFRDGGLADYLLIPSPRLLVPLQGLTPEDAAPLADAAATPYHSIRAALPTLTPGSTAVVIGVGGLGHAAIQLLRALCAARIVAVDVAIEKLELATRLGATEAVLSNESELRRAVGRSGAVLVLDFVGSTDTLKLATKLVAPRGRVAIIGAAGGAVPMTFSTLPYEAMIGNSVVGNTAELREIVALAAAGMLQLDIAHIRLEDVLETYRKLEANQLPAARAVAIPAA